MLNATLLSWNFQSDVRCERESTTTRCPAKQCTYRRKKNIRKDRIEGNKKRGKIRSSVFQILRGHPRSQWERGWNSGSQQPGGRAATDTGHSAATTGAITVPADDTGSSGLDNVRLRHHDGTQQRQLQGPAVVRSSVSHPSRKARSVVVGVVSRRESKASRFFQTRATGKSTGQRKRAAVFTAGAQWHTTCALATWV